MAKGSSTSFVAELAVCVALMDINVNRWCILSYHANN